MFIRVTNCSQKIFGPQSCLSYCYLLASCSGLLFDTAESVPACHAVLTIVVVATGPASAERPNSAAIESRVALEISRGMVKSVLLASVVFGAFVFFA